MDDIIDDYIDITHYIKYFKIYKYIVELKIRVSNNDNNNNNNDNNKPKKIVKKIYDFVNDVEVEEINYLDKIIKKNKYITEENLILYDTYKEAFDHNFMINKDWALFQNGYSDTYKSYVYKSDENYIVNKYIDEEYYHINGKKEGLYKKYNKNDLIKELNYVNDKLHGYCYFYNVIFIKHPYFSYGLNIVYRNIKFDNNLGSNKLKLNYI
jgi:hypothetical protein